MGTGLEKGQRDQQMHGPQLGVRPVGGRTSGLSRASPLSVTKGRGAKETQQRLPRAGKLAWGTQPKV